MGIFPKLDQPTIENMHRFVFLLLFLVCACQPSATEEKPKLENLTDFIKQPQATSLLGEPLYAAEPSEALIERYLKRKATYQEDSTQIDNIIWMGRFTAYMGNYEEAIRIYSQGLKRYPRQARLYRHRGHRYISTRQLDKAIEDFKKAEALTEGTVNQFEPDGMPNARNIPVSTLHGNIYYHLGLAYYLKQDMPNALDAYQKCLATSTMPDNVVSATHWLYMIARRMGKEEQANLYLKDITADMDIIENMAYHQACLFYKGEIEEAALGDQGDAPANDALAYAIANWYQYNGDIAAAKERLAAILEKDSWAAFGYIAAESDWAELERGE